MKLLRDPREVIANRNEVFGTVRYMEPDGGITNVETVSRLGLTGTDIDAMYRHMLEARIMFDQLLLQTMRGDPRLKITADKKITLVIGPRGQEIGRASW